MNIAIYIADLTEKNKHLMPWRTVLEVLQELQTDGHGTLLISGFNVIPNSEKDIKYGDVEGIEVYKPFSAKNRNALANCLKQRSIDTLFFPIAFSRTYSSLQDLEQQTACRIVWYIPGGWFRPIQILKASRYTGIQPVLPYLLQALMPKRYFVRKLTGSRNRAMITMTDYTATQLEIHGYPPELLFPAPPGKAPVKRSLDKPSVYPEIAEHLSGTRYFLFFGPPSPIRGINQIIEAFSTLAKTWQDVKLVCLFRGDSNVDPSKVRQQISDTALGDQIICFWDSVNGADLDLFLKNCFSVLKPFLIVPSEIPLAVLETAGYGKPVIGTGPDGTGAFIDNFGLTVPHADAKALALAMEKLLKDPTLFQQKCQEAKKLYASHPTWNDVAKIWLKAALVDSA